MAKKLRFSGKIPKVPIDADTSQADKKIDKLFNRIKGLQNIEVDADISQAQRRLETLVKRTNAQLTSSLLNGMVKDFKTVLGAMKTEFDKFGDTSDIYKSLERTCDMVESRFASLTVSVDAKKISGLTEILNAVTEIKSIGEFSFGEVVSRQTANNAEVTLSSVRQAKKEIDSIASKAAYIVKVLSKDAGKAFSTDKLNQYKDKLDGLIISLQDFYQIDDELVQNALLNAVAKINDAMGQVELKMPKAKGTADVLSVGETLQELGAAEKKLKAIEEVAKRISKNSSIAGLKELEQEAVNVTKALAEMYKDGIRDTERYITLQYKLSKIFDKIGKSYGGVRKSGAGDIAGLRDLIFDRILQVTGVDLIGSFGGLFEDLLGDSDFSLFNKSLSKLGMNGISELLLITGKTGDWVDMQKQATAAVDETTAVLHKEADAASNVVKNVLNMEAAIKRYNKVISETIRDGLFVGSEYPETQGWNIRDMVAQVQEYLNLYYQDDNVFGQLRFGEAGEKKAWKSETAKLERFIKAYEPYIEGLTTKYDRGTKFDNTSKVAAATSEQNKLTDAVNKTADAREREADAMQKNIDIKTKYSKIKLLEFTRDEYDAVDQEYIEDTLYLIREASKFGTKFSADMQTSCKKAATAVHRFFAAIDPNKYPAIASYKDGIIESVNNGYFSDISKTNNGLFTGEYSWEVQALDENQYYVFLNILDVAKNKEKEFSEYIESECKKRDALIEKQGKLVASLIDKYKQLSELKNSEPDWDQSDQIKSLKQHISYYEQIKLLLQDISSIKKEVLSTPGMSVGDIRSFGSEYGYTVQSADKHINHYKSMIMQETADLIDDLYGKYGTEQFSEIFGEIGVLDISNAEAMYDYLIAREKEYLEVVKTRKNAELRSDYTSPYSADQLGRLTRGTSLNKTLDDFHIEGASREEVVSLFNQFASIVAEQRMHGFQSLELDDIIGKITDIIQSVGYYNDGKKGLDYVDSLEKALKWLQASPIRYDDTYKAEFGDEWQGIIKQFAHGKGQILTKKMSAMSVNKMWDEFVGEFGHLLEDSSEENEYNQLRQIIDLAKKAKSAVRDKTKPVLKDIGSEDIASWLNLSQNIIEQNADAMARKIEAAAEAERKLAENAERAAKASKDIAVPFLPQDIDQAVQQINDAFNNKKVMIDLSNMASGEDLEDRVRSMIQNISGANMEVGPVIASDNVATVTLYNKALGVTRTLTFELSKATEDAAEAELKLKSHQDKYDSGASEKYLKSVLSLQEQLYTAKKKVAELDAKGLLDTSKGMKASRKVADLQGEYDKQVKLLQIEEQRTKVTERQTQLEKELNAVINEQQTKKSQQYYTSDKSDKTGTLSTYVGSGDGGGGWTPPSDPSSIKEQYRSLLSTISELNAINTQIASLQKKDNGSGILSQYLLPLQSDRAKLMAELERTKQDISNSLSQGFVQGDKKINIPLVNSLGEDLSVIDNFLNNTKTQTSLTTDEITKLVSELQKAQNIDINFLGDRLEQHREHIKQVQKENAYFADKTNVAVGADGTTKLNINDIQKLGQAGSTTKEQLEQLAQSIAANSENAVVLSRSFSQGADGIARLDFSVLNAGTGEIRDFTAALGTASGQMGVFETTVDKSLANINAARKQLDASGDLLGVLGKSGVDVSDSGATQQIAKLLELRKQLSQAIKDGDQTTITKLTKDLKIASSETEKLYKNMLKMESAIASGQATDAGKIDPKGDIYAQLANKAQEYAATQSGATLQIGNFDKAANALNVSLTHTNGTVEQLRYSMYGLGGEVAQQQTGVGKLTTSWDRFKTIAASAGKRLVTALVGYNVFFKAISEVRKGIGYVKEIDLALTELKKVTDATEASYKKFLTTAAGTAGEIGSTISDFTEATANFARLGYSIDESADMAKTAVVYKNVADGLDTVEEATDSIISTMKAFGIESSDTMGIIDRFNEVGNNFAITSAGIGEALQRSASALYAGGNTIDESIALVTAANSVIQNPEQVGTALKTLSLRLRGAKVELEEAGLETDNMAESTSTLQAKLKALTHGKVDIMLDAETFKSTTQILREMSQVWDEMTDIEQAAALELMGGKRQANILASVITNFETVEEVIETSMNSSGSALAENAKWMDSIEGKTTQLTNSMQTMWNDALSSDTIKYFLDIAISATNAIDKIGLLPSALAGVLVYLKMFKKISPTAIFSDLFNNFKTSQSNYAGIFAATANIKKMTSSGLASFAADKSLDANSVNAYASAVSHLSAQQQAAALTSAGFSQAQAKQILMQNGVEEATVSEVLGLNTLNVAQQTSVAITGKQITETLKKQGVTLSDASATWLANNAEKEITKTMILKAAATLKANGATDAEISNMLALASSANTASSSIKGATTSLWGMMKANPVGWIMTAISLLMVFAPKLEELFKPASEKLKELETAFEELRDKINTASKDFQSLKSSASEVIPRFTELAKGVDMFGKNVSLTDAEYEEFLSLNNQIAEMFPEINNGMDSNGNAMLALSFTADTLAESLWDLVEAQRAAANEEIADTMPDVLDNITETTKQYKNQIGEMSKTKESVENVYSDIVKSIQSGTNSKSFNISSVGGALALEQYKEALQELGVSFSEKITDTGSRSVTKLLTFDVDLQTLKKNYNNLVAGVDKEIQNVNDKIASKWKQLNPIVTAWTQTDYTYQGLSKDMQSVVQSMIGNLDFSGLGFANENDVQNYIRNNILNKIDGMSDEAQQKFSRLMSLDQSEFSTKEYIEEINTLAKSIEDMNEGWSVDDVLKNTGYGDIIDQCKDAVNKISDALSDGLNDNAMDVEGLKEKLYSLDPSRLTKALDIVKDHGIKTWDELAEALEKKTFDVVIDYDAEKEGTEKLLAAIEESMSATGLTAESIDNIKARYKDLEGYDPARLFEETANGVRLNTKALRELEDAYEAQNKDAMNLQLEDLVEQYNNLTAEIENCADASERANLYVQRQNVVDKINDAATLAARYEGLTSAYNKWQQAQSASNERDMYEGIIQGKEEMDEEMARGWVDEGTRKYLELLSGENLSTAPFEKVLEVYRQLDAVVGNAGYNVYDFFTTDDDGNSTTEGIYNFLDTVKSVQGELGKEWVKIGEDGSYSIDFGVNGDKAVADALGISEELVQIILRAAKDAGFEINLDSAYTELADLRDEAIQTNDRLKELGATDVTFNFNSTDITDLDKQISEAQKALQNLKNEDGTLKVGVSEDDYAKAQTMIATLVYQKQTLDDSAVLRVDTKDADAGIETVIQKFKAFKESYNELEVKTAIGADTTEAKANVDAAIASLQAEDPKILADLGVDLTATSAQINAKISTIKPEVMVTCGLDASLIEGYQAEEHTTNGTVIWNNNISAVTSWMAKTLRKTGTVDWGNNTKNVKTHFTATGTINWSGEHSVNGTAHAQGTAFKGGSWGAEKTETALVGELGPELLVRGDRWQTIGNNGAEFREIKKGDIIFNHKQTESLLKNGYITGRGKAYAEGTAFSSGSGPGRYTITSTYVSSSSNSSNKSSSKWSNTADSVSKAAAAADDFEETIDWIEIRLEEINEQLDLMNAQLENAIGYSNKNNIIDNLIGTNETKLKNLTAGIEKYTSYAAKLLTKVPSKYREAAQDGAISIADFSGKASESTVEAINNYREWAQKVADLKQQLEEVKAEIQDLAKQKFDNISDEYDNIVTLLENQNEKLDAQVSLMEDRGYVAATKYYETMATNTKKIQQELEKEKQALQSVLDQQVKAGNIAVESEEWYEMVDALYEVDLAIVECTSDLESYQNALNDIHWDNFDDLISRLEYLQDETQNLIDLMDNDDMVVTPETDDGWSADQVQWTEEGLASLGLYAQQMEIAEYQAKQYAEQIDELNKQYAAGRYSESEYLEKLEELTSAQYDSIEAYHDAQDAIVDLNEARIDEIKNGIERQIEAYEELIDKKKEALDAEKDLYDFQKSVNEQQKDIADIQRKLTALAGDNSMSAIAKRKKLEQELTEANAKLEETYYDRSVTNQKNALDKELEDFQEAKDAEIEKWEEYLNKVETVIAESLGIVQANASGIFDTLSAKADEYDLTLSNAIMTPWQDGALAVSDYQTVFDTAMSSTMDQLESMKMKWQEVIDKMSQAANAEVVSQQKQNSTYTAATKTPPQTTTTQTTTTTQEKAITVGGKINAGSAKIYSYAGATSGSKQYYSSDPIYTVVQEKNGYLLVRHHKLSSGVTGWFKKSDVKGYYKGSYGVDEDQLARIDELGEELVLHAGANGRLEFLTKGTGVIPADMTERLMDLAMDPSEVLARSTPQVGLSPSVVNNTMEINMQIAEVVHIDKATSESIPDITKAVEKQLNSYMSQLNGALRSKVR